MRKMKMFILLCSVGVLAVTQARAAFDTSKDILIAQFDSKPDEDDIHAQAALGSMLAHPSFATVNYYAVAGAYGVQADTYNFIDSTDLFNLAFGPENTKWTNAHTDRSGSVTRIKNVTKAVLNAGGAVWVQEAGQSDVTADWVAALIADGISEALIKSKVTVVQHSAWNQNNTDSTKLNYVKAKTTYVKLDDGNQEPEASEYWTPNFTSLETSYMDSAKVSSNAVARALWIEADRVCDASANRNPRIYPGGVDFSDCVENWWIFGDDSDVFEVASFWSKYVVPAEDSGGEIPDATSYYNESGGLVVMEAENTPSELGLWVNKTGALVNDPTGDGYLEFTGNSVATGPATSPLIYTFKINTDGVYFIHIRGARETVNDRNDVANDCYIRVEGDYDTRGGDNDATLEQLSTDNKFFITGDHNTFSYSYGGRLDTHEDGRRAAIYRFTAGETYTLVVSGRSQLFKLDRIVFCKTSNAIALAQDPTSPESEIVGIQPVGKYTYVATNDFPVINAGAVPYYVDAANRCLAINASEEAYRSLFAQASRTFDGVSGVYDVRITTLTEEDGESIYRLLVNGAVVGTYTNPYIGEGSALDRKTNLYTWEDISLQDGDTIAIESNTDTNGEIVEGTGTAWARGRWQQIELMAPDTTVPPKPEPTLVAEWKFNEESGSVASDTVGSNDGIISNASWEVDGVKGSALSFDGTGAVTIPTPDLSSISNAITVSMWLYGSTNQPANDTCFWASDAATNRVLSAQVPWSNTNVYWDAGYADAAFDRMVKAASPNEYRGQWNHWVFTKDADDGVMSIYVNGALWDSITGKTRAITGITALSIGGEAAGAYYSGLMDEIRIYDGALSSSSVATLFAFYGPNVPPTADSQSVDVQMNQSVSLTLSGNDTDGGSLSYRVVGDPTNGTLSGTAPNLTYTPVADFMGSDAFTFVVNDGEDDSVPAMVSITVGPEGPALIGQDNFDGDTLYENRTFSGTVNSGSATFDIVNWSTCANGDIVDTSAVASGQLALNAADEIGFLESTDTDSFLGINRATTRTLTYTFNISGYQDLNLSADWIFGENWVSAVHMTASIDGGAAQTVFNVEKDPANSGLTMEAGGTFDQSNTAEIFVNGTETARLSDSWANHSADIAGTGNTLTIVISEPLSYAGSLGLDNLELYGSISAVDGFETWISDYSLSGTNATESANPDGDRYTNYEEYIAGLNPDVADVFIIDGLTDGNRLEWNTATGRVYNIYWTSNLVDGFSLIESNALDGSFSTSNDAGDVQGFYKITVELPSTAE